MTTRLASCQGTFDLVVNVALVPSCFFMYAAGNLHTLPVFLEQFQLLLRGNHFILARHGLNMIFKVSALRLHLEGILGHDGRGHTVRVGLATAYFNAGSSFVGRTRPR
jgi:hypothetical protein